ncbi:hypothetical protein [Pleurocapsa sp. FMAR1]|uniref:hypothetical protein n=1 Tax=Pleurocapsa sp. FMAR1 TaxID=3040204 RepID=UPI0029C84741|nr:hypothetical protein [Pleurocapsa sp. FMAR1]
MTNPETKVQYEGAIFNQLVKNAEKPSVIELNFSIIEPKIEKIDTLQQKVDKIYSAILTIKWLTITIGIGVIIKIFSQPILIPSRFQRDKIISRKDAKTQRKRQRIKLQV